MLVLNAVLLSEPPSPKALVDIMVRDELGESDVSEGP